jgi:hypothetical protein
MIHDGAYQKRLRPAIDLGRPGTVIGQRDLEDVRSVPRSRLSSPVLLAIIVLVLLAIVGLAR